MAESQSILSQLQQKKADIEHQLAQLQGLEELSDDEYEEPEEEQNEEEDEDTKDEYTKEPEDTKEKDTKEEPEVPVVADYKSEDDDRLAKKIDSILEKKTIVRKCQKKIDKLIREVKSQIEGIMDDLDDRKEIGSKDLQYLATEYTEIMEEFSYVHIDILEELPEGYTLPKAYTDKVEKALDELEADVNRYLA